MAYGCGMMGYNSYPDMMWGGGILWAIFGAISLALIFFVFSIIFWGTYRWVISQKIAKKRKRK